MNERDVQRISELLARFPMYTQQFEKEEKKHVIQQPEKTLTTSESPKPHAVLQQVSTPPTCVLNEEDIPSEQFMKFSIGLRLLGEQKRERYLAYLFSLQEKNTKNKEPPKQ